MLSLHGLEDGSFLKNFPLELGSITDYSGRFKDTEIFYSFVSFLTPGLIYHCDLTQDELHPTVSNVKKREQVRGLNKICICLSLTHKRRHYSV